jgi:hypothetical protein
LPVSLLRLLRVFKKQTNFSLEHERFLFLRNNGINSKDRIAAIPVAEITPLTHAMLPYR